MIVIYTKFHANLPPTLPPPGYDGKIPPPTPAFPAFELNTERYGVSPRIQSECGKMRTRITPNTDTFQAVNVKQRALYLEQLLDLTMSCLSQYQS